MTISVRKAEKNDIPYVAKYLYELAAYEKLSDNCCVSEAQLEKLMFEENSLFALIAEADGIAAGIATYYFFKIATFSGLKVLYIEDIFVNEQYRKSGIGSTIFSKIKEIAKETNSSRIEWKCLDWNRSAINFYEKQGGISDKGWITYTISQENY